MIKALIRMFKKKPKQYVFIKCDECENEIIKDQIIKELNNGNYEIECGNCGNSNIYNFEIAPVPMKMYKEKGFIRPLVQK